MAPTDFSQQTFEIISCIFSNEDQYKRDCMDDRNLYEHDGPGNDDFDPVKIAAKLRELGDHYDETVIQPLMKDVKSASKDQVAAAFSNSVESLCRMWVAENAEVVPEKHLLKASITLALYVKKNCPDMTSTIQSAMTSFVNNRLSNWIIQQGGWERASLS